MLRDMRDMLRDNTDDGDSLLGSSCSCIGDVRASGNGQLPKRLQPQIYKYLDIQIYKYTIIQIYDYINIQIQRYKS